MARERKERKGKKINWKKGRRRQKLRPLETVSTFIGPCFDGGGGEGGKKAIG